MFLTIQIRRRRLARLGGGGSRSQGATPESNNSSPSLAGATGGSEGSSVDPPTPTSSRITTQHASLDTPSSQNQPGNNRYLLLVSYAPGLQIKTENIPILPVGILDFCKQKLLAPPVKPMNHVKRDKCLYFHK